MKDVSLEINWKRYRLLSFESDGSFVALRDA
jgi:hypothetical protein